MDSDDVIKVPLLSEEMIITDNYHYFFKLVRFCFCKGLLRGHMARDGWFSNHHKKMYD